MKYSILLAILLASLALTGCNQTPPPPANVTVTAPTPDPVVVHDRVEVPVAVPVPVPGPPGPQGARGEPGHTDDRPRDTVIVVPVEKKRE